MCDPRDDLDDLDDLWNRTTYSPGRAYSRSELATVIVAVELQRRLTAEGSECCSGLMCLLTSGEMIGRALTSAPSSPVS